MKHLVTAAFAFLSWAAWAEYTYVLNQPANLRFNKNQVLNILAVIPTGSAIRIPENYQTSNLPVRNVDGTVERTSTGSVTPVTIDSIPGVSAATVQNYNATPGGLYLTASIIGDMAGVEGDFDPISLTSPDPGFLKYYLPTGQPKFGFTSKLVKRFGANLNRVVDPATMPVDERNKWQRIMEELQEVADRTSPTPKSVLMIDLALAKQYNVQFETNGFVPLNGAWTIAVKVTAPRHGFPNVPCAEFMSEVLRQAYRRAGHDFTEDFNSRKGNPLIWSNTARVENFASALNVAGWIPWDTTLYAPVTGALLMNSWGDSPGHTYISAGDHGRFIVDNGSPQGRDLRTTSQKTIGMMYMTGVFFLPPGVIPPRW